MTPNDYLKKRLEECTKSNRITAEDKSFLEKNSIDEFIFRKISSKKFRKWSLDADSQVRIKSAISLNVSRNSPILFTFPFGGYKLHSLLSAPSVDWAEFFTIAYYSEWIAPISEVYKPGVNFCFSSDDVIVERMDNIPPKDTKQYFESFKKLLKYFNQYYPKNIKFEISRVGDLYSDEEFEKELLLNLEIVRKEYDSPDPERFEKMIKTSKLNIQWKGVEDWTKLPDKDKNEIVRMGPIYHDAYGKLSKRRAFVRAEDKIVTFTTPIPNSIAIGTTKNSVTKFWTGFGVLEKDNETYSDRILSPEQLSASKSMKYEEKKINLINLPNFEKIKIFTDRFTFSNSK